jgi:hypothetical protein
VTRMTDEEVAEAVNLANQWWTPEHMGVRLSREVLRARAREARLEAALGPFAAFAKAFDAKPLRGVADEFYTIHSGTENEASLSLAQCRAALAALEAE